MPYLRIKKTLLVRKMPLGTYLFVPSGFALESFSPIMEIDEATEELLKLCNGTHTREEILQQLASESGELIEEIAEDFDNFTGYMVGEDVLEWSEEPSFFEPIYKGDRPLSVTIDITSACNLHCPFCSVDAGTSKADDLTMDDIVPLVEQIRKLKPTPLGISGGEPLLKKEMLLYILEELSPVKEMVVSVFTNGTLVTKDYAQQLHDAGAKFVRVSVDGHTEKLHDAIRGKGAFKKTLQGIRYLRELGIHVDTISTISRLNYQYLKEIIDFNRQISDSYGIAPVYPYGRATGKDLFLNADEIFKIKVANSRSEKIQVNVSPRRCTAGETLYITANGDIFPCIMLRFPEFKVGNIRKNDLCEIYKTDLMQKILKWTIKDIEQCRDCDIRYFCGGGCRAYAHGWGNSFYGPDPINCESNRILARRIMENGEENTKRLLQELVKSTQALG